MSDLANVSATTFEVGVRGDREVNKQLSEMQDRIKRLNAEVSRLQKSTASAGNTNLRFTRTMRGTTRGSNRLGNATTQAGSALAALNGHMATAGGLMAGVLGFGIGQTVERLITLGAQAESTRERFLALAETIEDGRRRYQAFADFADDRGLEFRGLVEAANQLRVVGFAGDDLDELITQIGITAGDSVERVERITRALGQMRAFGRVALEELNQLTEAGIPIITAIANELDIPEGKVRGLIELGKIDFQTVRNAFADLASESSAFFAASEAQSETLQASFNRLGNAAFLFADAVNEEISPALKTFVEATADIVEFFATFEGSVIRISATLIAIAVPAFGLLLLGLQRFTGNTVDPIFRSMRLINLRLIRMSREAGRAQRVLLLLRAALSAAFNPAVLAVTVGIASAIFLATRRAQRLKEEARDAAEALKSIQDADPGTITEELRPELFSTAVIEIENLDRKIEAITVQAEQYYASWQNIKNEIEASGDATRQQERDLRVANEMVSQFSNTIQQLTLERKALTDALGETAPTQELGEDALSRLIRLQAATDELEGDLLVRLQEAQVLLETAVAFTPEQEEKALRSYIGFIERLQKEVVDANIAGLFFNPDGTTITTLNNAIAAATARLEELRESADDTVTPLEQLEAILQKNANTLLELDVSAEIGLVGEAEKAERIIEANQQTLRDLIVLYRSLSGEGGLTDEAIARFEQVIEEFRNRQPVGPEGLQNDLFAPLFEDSSIDDFRERLVDVFTDAEKSYNEQFRGFLQNITNIRGVGDEPGLINIFPDFDESQIDSFQRAEMEFYVRANDVRQDFIDEFEAQSVDFIQINYNQGQQFTEDNEERLKDYIEFGRTLGIYADDIVIDMQKAGDITEEEAFRLHNVIGEATDEIEQDAERTQAALDQGFTFRVSPQLFATANAILTAGEAFVSAGAAAGNLISIFQDGSTAFDEPRLGIIATANALATLISIGEQPILAAQDAVISFSKVYEQFLEVLQRSDEEIESQLQLLPEQQANEIRQLITDFREVFSRVGTGFDADAFRLLPTRVQDILQDAFDQYRGIEPTLQDIFESAREIVENENITLAERVRQTGRLIADELGDSAISLGQSIANIIDYIGDAGDSFDIFREVVGGVGEVLGLGRDRTVAFVDGLDLLLRTGESTLILSERINQTINLSTLRIVLGFSDLAGAAGNLDEAYQRVAVSGLRVNAAFDRGRFALGEYSEGLSELNDTLNITSLGLEDGAIAIGSFIASGGSLAGVIAPGVGLLAESVGNVLDAAADYVAVNRVIQSLPPWFRQGDIDTFQRAIRELDNYTTAAAQAQELQAQGFEVELPDLSPLAQDAQSVISALTALQPLITSDLFDQFLADRDFPELFPESELNLGQQYIQALKAVADGAGLTTEQMEALGEAIKALTPEILRNLSDAMDQTLQNTIQIARGFSSVLSTLSETIVNNTRVQVAIMRQELDGLRDDRLEREKELNEQLERETDALGERLNAGLISLEEYYSEIDQARAIAEQEREAATKAEIELLNQIQEAEYEAAVNAFNINKATRLADIAINAAASFAATVGQTGFFGIPLGGIVAALAAAQAVLVLAQQPPPKPAPITALQTGGVVTGPTNALIGEAGPEAVIPLDEYEFNRRDRGPGITVVVNNYGGVIEERRIAESVYKATKEAQRVRRVPARR